MRRLPALARHTLIALAALFGALFAGSPSKIPAGVTIAGVSVERLAQSVRSIATCPVHLIRSVDELPEAVAALAKEGDLVITLGAGSIGGVADRILDVIRKGPERESAS